MYFYVAQIKFQEHMLPKWSQFRAHQATPFLLFWLCDLSRWIFQLFTLTPPRLLIWRLLLNMIHCWHWKHV